MTGEGVLMALASLLGALAVVGGAILWLARLAAGQVIAAHGERVDRDVDALRAELAALREQVAELRGEARPTLAAVERLLHALEGGRR